MLRLLCRAEHYLTQEIMSQPSLPLLPHLRLPPTRATDREVDEPHLVADSLNRCARLRQLEHQTRVGANDCGSARLPDRYPFNSSRVGGADILFLAMTVLDSCLRDVCIQETSFC